MSNLNNRDRYTTFEGLDCDANATRVMETLRQYIQDSAGTNRWADYFASKLIEKEKLGVDDLFFVGSQMNNIYAFFEEFDSKDAHELLYQVEQECC